MCLNRHFRTFEALCTPPHKPQKSVQNDYQTVRFCNGLGRHLRDILDCLAGLSPIMPLSQPFHVADFEASETRNRRKG